MSLTGIGDDPTPAIRREIIFAQGDTLGGTSEQALLLMGNKTSAGSETVETLGTRLLSDQDVKDRFGARSEIYQGWRTAAMVFGGAPKTVYAYAVTEAGGGTAGTCTFTFAAGAATNTTSLIVTWGGFTVNVSIASGDSAIVQAAAFAAAVTSAESGTWPFTAAIGGGGSEHIVTVTSANVGTRAELALSRLTATYAKSVTTTCTKSAVSNGTGVDDYSTAFTNIANAGTFKFQVSAKHTTSAPTPTDNGIGEHGVNITTQALPVNGKGQVAIFGLVGTNGEAATVATTVNNPRCYFFWAENSPWTPMMIAAHNAAVMLVEYEKHPSANLTGYTYDATKGRIYSVPAPAAKTDYPTATEIKTALNSGVCPIAFTTLSAAYLARHVTSYSLLSGTAVNDFRCREGHIPNAIDTFWDAEYTRRLARKQPFLASTDLVPGQRPLPNTDYPATIRNEMSDLIDNFCGAKPLGKYDGPILDPSSATAMKASIATGTTTNGGGGHTVEAKLVAVIHNNSFEAKLFETSAPQ